MNVVVRNINTDNLTQGKGSTVRHFIVNKLNLPRFIKTYGK